MRLRYAIVTLVTLAGAFVAHPLAYVLEGPRWANASVPYYVNPTNIYVSTSAATAAVQYGMSAWSLQSTAAFSFYYAGTTNAATLANDGQNNIFFRNDSNGAVAAETYWWSDASNHLVDADVVVHEAAYALFTGTSGCSNGLYIEDIMTHEAGHALGLAHSTVTTATMYPSISLCSMSLRTLDPDDLAGVEYLYPPGPTASTKTPPSVTISSPSNNGSYPQGTMLTFTGSATDTQDGNISAKIVWSSNVSGQLGTGSSLSVTLPTGTQVITATVTDSAGLTSSTQETQTIVAPPAPSPPPPPPPPPTGISLTAKGSKAKGGLQSVTLKWSGSTAANMDVYRNGILVYTTPNDGTQVDALNRKGSATYTYQVCASGTLTCSNIVTIVF
jgi:hypothetical protein